MAAKPLALTALVALSGLLVYAVALRQGLTPSVAWYWLLIGVIDGAIMLQILLDSGRGHSRGDWLILAQIAGLTVLLSLMVVWVAPYGLFGRDPHFNLSATEAIGRWGWPVPDDAGLLKRTHNYSLWPGMDVLNLTISEITGISHLELARYLPGAVKVLSVVFLYIVAKSMFRSGQAGLLAALAVAHITTHVVFQAEYVREAFAFPLLMGVAALVVKGRLDMRGRVIVLVLLGAIAFYHHLTSLIALLLIATVAVGYWLTSLERPPFRGRFLQTVTLASAESRGTLAVFAGIIFFAYAVYIGPLIIEVLADEIKRLVDLHLGSSAVVGAAADARQQFVYYGGWTVTGIMGVTLFVYLGYRYLVVRAGPRWSPAELPLFLWVALVGAWVAASNYGGVLIGADPMRLLTFGYPFLLLLFAQVGLHTVASKGLPSGALPALTMMTVAVFLAVNLLNLNGYVFDPSGQPDYRTGEVSLAYPPELYAANDWQVQALPSGAVLAGDVSTREILGGLSQREVVPDPDFYQSAGASGQYDGFVLREEMSRLSYFARVRGQYRFFPLDREELDRLLDLRNYALAYDNGDTRILVSEKVRP